jgi:2-polyprenyl-3-methyl-5-hydroxy-6-metoxy-1,4-benzoquinol methylase
MSLENYVKHSKEFFNRIHDGMSKTNHVEHDVNADYWDMLLGDPKNNPDQWKGKNALDFGCGCGRNIRNMCKLTEWSSVDGCDISVHNARYSKEYADSMNTSNASISTWENDGFSINSLNGDLPNKKYDFVMSTIVFEHIAPYSVRRSIMESIYECLNTDGMFSLSLSNLANSVDYYSNEFLFPKNALINNQEAVRKDFSEIGFKDVSVQIGSRFENRPWTYIKGFKK